MAKTSETLTIGAFARAAGVNVETIRFYQRKGLLTAPDRPLGGIRRYEQSDVARVRFVKSAQRLGFSLDEVAQLLNLEDGSHCNKAAELAAIQLAEVRAKLEDLVQMESALSKLIDQCHAQRGDLSCPLIASLKCHAKVP